MPFWRMSIEDVTLDQIYEFMERGNINNAPEPIVQYLRLLDDVRGMIYRFDIYGNREGVIKHLVTARGLSRYKANLVYNETIEYFYVDVEVSKRAWINFYAEKMDKVINFAMLAMKDTADAAKVLKMLVDAATHREVHVPDKEETPEGFFDKPINLLSLDSSIFEFGTANRVGLEQFIESIPDLTEKEKIRIKQEARILPLKIFPDEQEDPRRS